MDYVDVVVVGAGISGIGAAYHLKTRCPNKSFAVVEARERLGGTWDLFRYPGIRSDSDMFTLGYSFKPWTQAKAIADGPSILKYLNETVDAFDLRDRIRFGVRVTAARWNSETSRWTVDLVEAGAARQMQCNFLFMCTGYYSYARGHRPHFDGEESFSGPIVEPQFWPADLDYAGKQVVVIGSGATAVTLVPAMAGAAAKVTMLQRSPTWVVSRPGEDALANRLRRLLPGKLAYALIRWRNVLMQMWFYGQARKKPEKARKALLDMAKAELGAETVEAHFTPRYNPWDQRLCLIPDADLFAAIRQGRAEVVTDHIDRFVSDGILLKSGRTLAADVIVAATGLDMQLLSGAPIVVDGERVDFSRRFTYKGMMFSGVPNLASVFGYINASWTLKAELIAQHVCNIVGYMDARGFTEARPAEPDAATEPRPWFDFSSGYIQRGMVSFPNAGAAEPYVAHQNYLKDRRFFRPKTVEDGVLRFSGAPATAPSSEREAA